MLGYQLDSMILRVLSNRNDSVILCISNSQLLGTSLNTGLLQKKERSESCSSVLKDHSGKLFLKERVTRPALQDQGDHEASRAPAEPSPPPLPLPALTLRHYGPLCPNILVCFSQQGASTVISCPPQNGRMVHTVFTISTTSVCM